MNHLKNLQTLQRLHQQTLSQKDLQSTLVSRYTVSFEGALVKKSSFYGRVIQLVRFFPGIQSSSERVKAVTLSALQSLTQLDLSDQQFENYKALRERLSPLELEAVQESPLLKRSLDQQSQSNKKTVEDEIHAKRNPQEQKILEQSLWNKSNPTPEGRIISKVEVDFLTFPKKTEPTEEETFRKLEFFKNHLLEYVSRKNEGGPIISASLPLFLESVFASKKQMSEFEEDLLSITHKWHALSDQAQKRQEKDLAEQVSDQIEQLACKIRSDCVEKTTQQGTVQFFSLGVENNLKFTIQRFLSAIKQQGKNIYIGAPFNKPLGEIQFVDLLNSDLLPNDLIGSNNTISLLLPLLHSISLLDLVEAMQRPGSNNNVPTKEFLEQILTILRCTGLSEYQLTLSFTLLVGTESLQLLLDDSETTAGMPDYDVCQEVLSRMKTLTDPSHEDIRQDNLTIDPHLRAQNGLAYRSNCLRKGLLSAITSSALQALPLSSSSNPTISSLASHSNPYWFEIASNGNNTYQIQLHTPDCDYTFDGVPLEKLSEENIAKFLSFKFLPLFDSDTGYSFTHLLDFATTSFGTPRESSRAPLQKNPFYEPDINDRLEPIIAEKYASRKGEYEACHFAIAREAVLRYYHQEKEIAETEGSEELAVEKLQVSLEPHIQALYQQAIPLHTLGLVSDDERNELFSTLLAIKHSKNRIQDSFEQEKAARTSNSTKQKEAARSSLTPDQHFLAALADSFIPSYQEGLEYVQIARDYIGENTAKLIQLAIDAKWPQGELTEEAKSAPSRGSFSPSRMSSSTNSSMSELSGKVETIGTKKSDYTSLSLIGEVAQKLLLEREAPYLVDLLKMLKSKKVVSITQSTPPRFFIVEKIKGIAWQIFINTVPKNWVEPTIQWIRAFVQRCELIRKKVLITLFSPSLLFLPRKEIEDTATHLLVYFSPHATKVGDFSVKTKNNLFFFDAKQQFKLQTTNTPDDASGNAAPSLLETLQQSMPNCSLEQLPHLFSKIGTVSSEEPGKAHITPARNEENSPLRGNWDLCNITWPSRATQRFPYLNQSVMHLTRTTSSGQREVIVFYQRENAEDRPAEDRPLEYAHITLDEDFQIDQEKLQAAGSQFTENLISTLSMRESDKSSSLPGLRDLPDLLQTGMHSIAAKKRGEITEVARLMQITQESATYEKIPLDECLHHLSFLNFEQSHFLEKETGASDRLHVGSLDFSSVVIDGKLTYESTKYPGFVIASEQLLPSNYPLLSQALILEKSGQRIAVIDPSIERHKFSLFPGIVKSILKLKGPLASFFQGNKEVQDLIAKLFADNSEPYHLQIDHKGKLIPTCDRSAWHMLFDAVLRNDLNTVQQCIEYFEEISKNEGLSFEISQKIQETALVLGAYTISTKNKEPRKHLEILEIALKLQVLVEPSQIKKEQRHNTSLEIEENEPPQRNRLENFASSLSTLSESITDIARIRTQQEGFEELLTSVPKCLSLLQKKSVYTPHNTTLTALASALELTTLCASYQNYLKLQKTGLFEGKNIELELKILQKIIKLKKNIAVCITEEADLILEESKGGALPWPVKKSILFALESALGQVIRSDISHRLDVLRAHPQNDVIEADILSIYREYKTFTNLYKRLQKTQASLSKSWQLVEKSGTKLLGAFESELPKALPQYSKSDFSASIPRWITELLADPGSLRRYVIKGLPQLISTSVSSSLELFNPIINSCLDSTSSDLYLDIENLRELNLEVDQQWLDRKTPWRYKEVAARFDSIWELATATDLDSATNDLLTRQLQHFARTNNYRQKMLASLLLAKLQQKSILSTLQTQATDLGARAALQIASSVSLYGKDIEGIPNPYTLGAEAFSKIAKTYNLPDDFAIKFSDGFQQHLMDRGFSLERAQEIFDSLRRPIPDAVPDSAEEFERFATQTLVSGVYCSLPNTIFQSLLQSTKNKVQSNTKLSLQINNPELSKQLNWLAPLAPSWIGTSQAMEKVNNAEESEEDTERAEKPVSAAASFNPEKLSSAVSESVQALNVVHNKLQIGMNSFNHSPVDLSVAKTQPIIENLYPPSLQDELKKDQATLHNAVSEKITAILSSRAIEDAPHRAALQTGDLGARCLQGISAQGQEIRIKVAKIRLVSTEIKKLALHCSEQAKTLETGIESLVDPLHVVTHYTQLTGGKYVKPTFGDLVRFHRKGRFPKEWPQETPVREAAFRLTSKSLFWLQWAQHLEKLESLLNQCEKKVQQGGDADSLLEILQEEATKKCHWIETFGLNSKQRAACSHYELQQGSFLSENQVKTIKKEGLSHLESIASAKQDFSEAVSQIQVKPLSECRSEQMISFAYPFNHSELLDVYHTITEHVRRGKNFELPLELLQELMLKKKEGILSVEGVANAPYLNEIFTLLSTCRQVQCSAPVGTEKLRVSATLLREQNPLSVKEIHSLFHHLGDLNEYEEKDEEYLNTHVQESTVRDELKNWNEAKRLVGQLQDFAGIQFFAHKDGSGITFHTQNREDAELLKEHPKALLLSYLLYLCDHIHEVSDLDRSLPRKMSPLAVARTLKKELTGEDPLLQVLENFLQESSQSTQKEKSLLLTTPVCALLALFGGPSTLDLGDHKTVTLGQGEKLSGEKLSTVFPQALDLIRAPYSKNEVRILKERRDEFISLCNKVHREPLNSAESTSTDSPFIKRLLLLSQKSQSGIVIDATTPWPDCEERDNMFTQLFLSEPAISLPEGFCFTTYDDQGQAYVWRNHPETGRICATQSNEPPQNALTLLLPHQTDVLIRLRRQKEQASQNPLLLTGPQSTVSMLLSSPVPFDLIDTDLRCDEKVDKPKLIKTLLKRALDT